MNNSLEKTKNGRKFHMGLICIVSLAIGLVAIAFVPALTSTYAVYAGGLSGLYAIYCGGNVANKLVLTRPGVETRQIESNIKSREE